MAEALKKTDTKPSGVLLPSLSREEYDRLQQTNWSTLKFMAKSPAHYRHALIEGYGSTQPQQLGRVRHMAVFEPERFASECVAFLGKVRRGKEWDAFREANAGKEIVTPRELRDCRLLAAAARADAIAAPYLSGGKAEVTLLWTHRTLEDGAEWVTECKGRVDFVADCGALVDLKTTRDASPEGFGREMLRYRYHVQAAMYQDAYEACTGQRLPFVFVAVETAAPYVVSVLTLPPAAEEAGREEYRTLLGRLAVCRQSSKWPGYVEGVAEVELPKWSGLADEDDDLSDIGINFDTGGEEGDE